MRKEEKDFVKNFFNIWGEASRNNDRATLEKIISDDYLFVNPRGARLTKTQMIDGTLGGEPVFSSFEVHDDQMRAYKDSAIRTGRLLAQGKHKGRDGVPRSIGGEFRYTNMFVKRESGWQIALTQMTEVTVPAEERQQ
jgi:ketosteroid isomerase-like protein